MGWFWDSVGYLWNINVDIVMGIFMGYFLGILWFNGDKWPIIMINGCLKMRDTPQNGRFRREMMSDKPKYGKTGGVFMAIWWWFLGIIIDDALEWVRLAKVAAFAEPMQLLRYRSGLTGGCADRRVSLEEFPESLISWLMIVFILSRHFVVAKLSQLDFKCVLTMIYDV